MVIPPPPLDMSASIVTPPSAMDRDNPDSAEQFAQQARAMLETGQSRSAGA